MKFFKNNFLLVTIFYLVLISQITFSQKKFEAKIDSILAIMTVEEKIGQLNQLSSGLGFGPVIAQDDLKSQKQLVREGKIGSFLNAIGADLTRDFQKTAVEETRMKIPLIFGLDVIHGFKTTFPIPLAEASTWNPSLVELSSRIQAKEASASGIHWTFAPMVDIARDPRWGRIAEGSGEDTYLGSVMAYYRVKGFQGNLDSKENIVACAKHYAAYGDAIGGRDYNTVEISDRVLRETYLPPFKACVDAGIRTFMCSFNEISGIPSSGNRYLLTDILRNEWKFDGFVVSDWNSVGELIPHGFADGPKQAAELGLNAGVDMDMESRCYINHLSSLVSENKVTMATLDEAVRRILRVKFELGLFDDPYKYCDAKREKSDILTKENKDAALKVARESIVLLKNENSLLPLKKDVKNIAVVGPLADDLVEPVGTWAGLTDEKNMTSVLQGIKNKLGKNVNVAFSKGCEINGDSKAGFADAINLAKKSDVVILVVGEAADQSGEAASRSDINLPGVQEDFVKEIKNANKNVVVVLMNGRPLSISWIAENIPAIVESWHLGIQCGTAITDVLFGDFNPSGKLPVTFPRTVGQVPIYYNQKNTGRPGVKGVKYTSQYLDLPLTPLYPFGHGLSYSKFEYGDLKLSSATMSDGDVIKASMNVKNTGAYDGDEVVQFYIRDIAASVTRPVKELKGFQKITLKKGESKTVEFTIDKNTLSFYDKDMKWNAEPGEFDIFIGTSSADVKTAKLNLK